MAFEFLYILQVCWLSSMGSTRRGDTSQLHNNDTYPSARPTLSSSNQHPGSSPSLSYVSPDTTFLRHNPGNYFSATLLSNLCPTLLPHNPSPVGYYPDQPRPIHRSIPQSYFTSPRQRKSRVYQPHGPASPSRIPHAQRIPGGHDQDPQTTFEWSISDSCQVIVGTYRKTLPLYLLYYTYSLCMYSPRRHPDQTHRITYMHTNVAIRDTTRAEGSVESVVQKALK